MCQSSSNVVKEECDFRSVRRSASALCRSRRELSKEYLLAKFAFDTAENEPCKVCPLSAYRSPQVAYGRSMKLFIAPLVACALCALALWRSRTLEVRAVRQMRTVEVAVEPPYTPCSSDSCCDDSPSFCRAVIPSLPGACSSPLLASHK